MRPPCFLSRFHFTRIFSTFFLFFSFRFFFAVCNRWCGWIGLQRIECIRNGLDGDCAAHRECRIRRWKPTFDSICTTTCVWFRLFLMIMLWLLAFGDGIGWNCCEWHRSNWFTRKAGSMNDSIWPKWIRQVRSLVESLFYIWTFGRCDGKANDGENISGAQYL